MLRLHTTNESDEMTANRSTDRSYLRRDAIAASRSLSIFSN